jgi:hypothetical protein
VEGQINRLKALKRQMHGALAWNYFAPECCRCQFWKSHDPQQN